MKKPTGSLLLAAAVCAGLALLTVLPKSGALPSSLPPLVTAAPEALPPGEGLIDLNTAQKEQLMTLPGVGEVRAEAILAYRERYGPFRTVSELAAVESVGGAVLDLIRGRVTVSPAP